MERSNPHAQKFHVELPRHNLESSLSPPGGPIDMTNATVMTDSTMTMDEGDTSAGSDHDKLEVRIQGEDHGLSYHDSHGHVSNFWHLVAEGFGEDTFSIWVKESGVRAIVKSTTDVEAGSFPIK